MTTAKAGNLQEVSQTRLMPNCLLIIFGSTYHILEPGAYFIGPASLNKDEKKRLVKLWEEGTIFVPLPLKGASKKPIPFWGMETERKLVDKEKKKHYPIRYIYIFSRTRREVIRHTRAKRFKKAKMDFIKSFDA